MEKKLTPEEVKVVLSKIRSKYEKIITEFKKSRIIVENFDERYISALRNRQDVSIFLMAEIEVVEELYKKEKENKEKEAIGKPQKATETRSVADKIFDENRQKIIKYTKIDLGKDADEELERLLGAVREYLNDYFPAIIYIYKERRHTAEGDHLNDFYHKFLTQYDYKGDFPISRQYVASLDRLPKDFKKIDYEHRYIMQESAFILNDLLEALDMIIKKNSIPMPETVIKINKKAYTEAFFHLFNNKSYEFAVKKNFEHLDEILNDFRFKGLKKNYKL